MKKFPPLPAKFETKLVYRDIIDIKLTEDNCFTFEGGDKYKTFNEAYDAVYELHPDALPGFDAEEIVEALPKHYSGSFGTLISNKERRMFFSYSSASRDSLWNMESEYKFFLKNCVKPYLKKPKNFYNAYQFVQSHPIFWKLYGDINRNGTLHWETNDGLQDAWHTVYRNKKGKVFHMLEVGEPMDEEVEFNGEKIILPNRISAHDLELDAGGYTYEEAIVDLAKRIHKLYDVNGAKRS